MTEDKFEQFLDSEVGFGLSDDKTIARIKWYYQTYFKDAQSKGWTDEDLKAAWNNGYKESINDYADDSGKTFEQYLKQLKEAK